VKSWIRIRSEVKIWIRIRIHIEVKSWIRIRFCIKVMRIRDPDLFTPLLYQVGILAGSAEGEELGSRLLAEEVCVTLQESLPSSLTLKVGNAITVFNSRDVLIRIRGSILMVSGSSGSCSFLPVPLKMPIANKI
jgi:hypothetical protein